MGSYHVFCPTCGDHFETLAEWEDHLVDHGDEDVVGEVRPDA